MFEVYWNSLQTLLGSQNPVLLMVQQWQRTAIAWVNLQHNRTRAQTRLVQLTRQYQLVADTVACPNPQHPKPRFDVRR